MEYIPIAFLDKARQVATRLQNWKKDRPVLIIGHRDGDGLSAASVLYQSLSALGFKKLTTLILLSPELEIIKEYLNENSYDYVITGDIGASFEEYLKETVIDFIIADHHPNESGVYGRHQLNPCEFEMNDEIDCSGSSLSAFLFLHNFPQEFWTTETGCVILCYAISGAVSDFQMRDGPVSVNKYIADFAANCGAISMRKDICFFGRGMYPVYVALNRSGIPGFEDLAVCKTITSNVFELKENEYWKRIVDLSQEEKAKLVEAIAVHLLSNAKLDINASEIIKGVINYIYDLEGLRDWDCTLIPDGRRTIDAREILHRVNYVSRRGKANLALDLLNHKSIDEEIWNTIESHHRQGDQEVAQALELYESGKISMESWDERVIMADFSGIIYYDEVGVVASVIMKKFQNIEIMLSYCEIQEGNIVKLSTRARDDIWNLVEEPSQTLSDAKTVYHQIRKKYPTKIMQYGGHRWACSGYLKRDIVPELFNEMVKYYKFLKGIDKKEVERVIGKEEIEVKPIKQTTDIKSGQMKLDKFI